MAFWNKLNDLTNTVQAKLEQIVDDAPSRATGSPGSVAGITDQQLLAQNDELRRLLDEAKLRNEEAVRQFQKMIKEKENQHKLELAKTQQEVQELNEKAEIKFNKLKQQAKTKIAVLQKEVTALKTGGAVSLEASTAGTPAEPAEPADEEPISGPSAEQIRMLENELLEEKSLVASLRAQLENSAVLDDMREQLEATQQVVSNYRQQAAENMQKLEQSQRELKVATERAASLEQTVNELQLQQDQPTNAEPNEVLNHNEEELTQLRAECEQLRQQLSRHLETSQQAALAHKAESAALNAKLDDALQAAGRENRLREEKESSLQKQLDNALLARDELQSELSELKHREQQSAKEAHHAHNPVHANEEFESLTSQLQKRTEEVERLTSQLATANIHREVSVHSAALQDEVDALKEREHMLENEISSLKRTSQTLAESVSILEQQLLLSQDQDQSAALEDATKRFEIEKAELKHTIEALEGKLAAVEDDMQDIEHLQSELATQSVRVKEAEALLVTLKAEAEAWQSKYSLLESAQTNHAANQERLDQLVNASALQEERLVALQLEHDQQLERNQALSDQLTSLREQLTHVSSNTNEAAGLQLQVDNLQAEKAALLAAHEFQLEQLRQDKLKLEQQSLLQESDSVALTAAHQQLEDDFETAKAAWQQEKNTLQAKLADAAKLHADTVASLEQQIEETEVQLQQAVEESKQLTSLTVTEKESLLAQIAALKEQLEATGSFVDEKHQLLQQLDEQTVRVGSLEAEIEALRHFEEQHAELVTAKDTAEALLRGKERAFEEAQAIAESEKLAAVAQVEKQLVDAQQLIQELEAKVEATRALPEHISTLEARLSDAQQQEQHLQAKLSEANPQIQRIPVLEGQLADAQQHMQNLEAKVEATRTQSEHISTLEAQLAGIQRETEDLRVQLAQAREQIEQHKSKVQLVEAEKSTAISELQKQLQEKSAELEQSSKALATIQAQLSGLEAQLAASHLSHDQAVQLARDDSARIMAERDTLMQTVSSLREQLKTQADSVARIHTAHRAALATLETELASKSDAMEELENTVNETNAQLQLALSEQTRDRAELASVQSQIATLEEQCSSHNSARLAAEDRLQFLQVQSRSVETKFLQAQRDLEAKDQVIEQLRSELFNQEEEEKVDVVQVSMNNSAANEANHWKQLYEETNSMLRSMGDQHGQQTRELQARIEQLERQPLHPPLPAGHLEPRHELMVNAEFSDEKLHDRRGHGGHDLNQVTVRQLKTQIDSLKDELNRETQARQLAEQTVASLQSAQLNDSWDMDTSIDFGALEVDVEAQRHGIALTSSERFKMYALKTLQWMNVQTVACGRLIRTRPKFRLLSFVYMLFLHFAVLFCLFR